MTDSETPWEPVPAYPQLAALAAEMRPDWSRKDLWDAILAARSAGQSWKDIYREVSRLVWAEDETPATLRNSARKPGPGVPAPLDPALKARLLADLASRATGPQPVLNDSSSSNERKAG